MNIKSIKNGEDAKYESLTDFSCTAADEVKTDIPALLSTVAGRDSADPVEEDYTMIAEGDVWSISTDKVPGGGKLEIEAISANKSGLAGTDDEVATLPTSTDFKYNVKLECPDLPHQETEAFVYLQIDYEIDTAIVPVSCGELKASASTIYLVEGSNLILHMPNKYYMFDESSSTMQERTMEQDGYPKLSTSPDDENVNVKFFTSISIRQGKARRNGNIRE